MPVHTESSENIFDRRSIIAFMPKKVTYGHAKLGAYSNNRSMTSDEEGEKIESKIDILVARRIADLLDSHNRRELELTTEVARLSAEVQLKSALLSNMSHDIRSQLASILGYAQILSEEVGEQQQEFVDFIQENGKLLLNTLNAILDLSRMESENVNMNREVVNLVDSSRHAVALHTPAARKRDIALRLDDVYGEVTSFADRAAVDRILNNLIGNALKFTDEGEIVINLETAAPWVRLTVRDTGAGIDAAFLPHIFDAFRQENATPAEGRGGSGLGMAITHRLVELLGGHIEVKSQKGVGTSFCVYLPQQPMTELDGTDRASKPGRRTRRAKVSQNIPNSP